MAFPGPLSFMMKCSSGNRAPTVLQRFRFATATYRLPHKIRTDGGSGNHVWWHMIQRRGCVLVDSSVYNTHIEKALERCEKVSYSTDTHYTYCTKIM